MSWRQRRPSWPFYASTRGLPRGNGWRRRVDTPRAIEALRSARMGSGTRAALAVLTAGGAVEVTCYETMAGATCDAYFSRRPFQVFALETR